MEEIKVGEYVRTDMGICKITSIKGTDKNRRYCIDICFPNYDLCFVNLEMIKKHSPNIIDLIEVGDYVNGYLVTRVCNKEPCSCGKWVDIDCDRPSEYCTLWEGDIKSIVTHEQFEAMKYKVE